VEVPASPLQHTSAYVSIRQHTPAYVSIRQHELLPAVAWTSSISTHTNTHLTCPHPSASVRKHPHTSAYVSMRGGPHLLHLHTHKHAPDLSTSASSNFLRICFSRGSLELGSPKKLRTVRMTSDAPSSSGALTAKSSGAYARQHTSAYVSIRQHTSAHIRQHTSERRIDSEEGSCACITTGAAGLSKCRKHITT
jgi:hypothetical protein